MVYVEGQLSDLPRKSVEPIALAADVPVRTLQEFLSQHRWQEDRARDRLQEIVAEEHAHPHAVGVIDETSMVKQGTKTPGVQRQYLGTVGKQENGNVLDPTEMKFFVSNAPPETSAGTILVVAFSRWRVERCFEDSKGEVGLDHYEGRRYPGLKRHMILSAISYLFLARTNQRLRGKKIRVDRLPSPRGRLGADSLVVVEPAPLGKAAGKHRPGDPAGPTSKRLRSPLPHQANSPSFAGHGHQADEDSGL